MKKSIFIKYNPYKLETEITIDNQPVKKNSALNVKDKRLQEWVEDLPEILVDECNVKDFDITFHGTMLDYEDVMSVVGIAKNKGISITVKHIPAKEVSDKERAIEEIFNEIQTGPFEELKQKDIIKSFEIAKSSEFPVSVVATMSAGKSTLINALLNQKLMPAKNEACTATITEIKDNDNETFVAEVFDKEGNLLEVHPELELGIMEKLNSNPEVSRIVVSGNIPFVDSDDVSLVLVDTPGPNNSRDPEHKATTYRLLSESSKALVLYIMNATQLAVNDDYALLSHVADSMKVGGKQSKDRFIFVVNKLDDFKKGEDSVENAIDKVRKYLEDRGIENPNIFPASALTALEIRTICQNIDFSDPVVLMQVINNPDLIGPYSKIVGINQNNELHLEKYAPLTPSVRAEITKKLAVATEDKDIKQTALIHTGVPSIESAIRVYIEKYAKTAKIRNIYDTFDKKLESAKTFEKTKSEISTNQKKKDEIVAQIEVINKKLNNGEEAKKFKDTIEKLNFDKEVQETANSINNEAQTAIRTYLEKNDANKKLSKSDAEQMCRVFSAFSDDLQANVQVKLETAVTEQIKKNAQRLLEQYTAKIADLSSDISIGSINISPFALLKGELGNTDGLINGLIKEETVVVKESEWVANTSKKWYKPWTWFQESGHWTDEITEKREYVEYSLLSQRFFAPIQKQLYTNVENAVKYSKTQTFEIKREFKAKFDELDEVLVSKLAELKACATNVENTDLVIRQTEERLAWLESIHSKIESILEI